MRRTVISIAFLLLSGCASMSPQQCLRGDWTGQGLSDGLEGLPLSRLTDHAKACAKSGVAPDEALYRQGREQGLAGYCTPDHAFLVSRLGEHYRGVCPPDSEPAVLTAFANGGLVHSFETRLTLLTMEIANTEARADKAERDARDVRKQLRNDNLTTAQRGELEDRLDHLLSKRSRSREARWQAEADKRDAERDLEELKVRLQSDYGAW